MFAGYSYANKKLAVVASFDVERGCTNWKGWRQALDTLDFEWWHWDLLNEQHDELVVNSIIRYEPDYLLILLSQFVEADLQRIKDALPKCKFIMIYPDYWPGASQMPKGKSQKLIDYLFINSRDQVPLFEFEYPNAKVSYLPMGCYSSDETAVLTPKYKGKMVFVGNLEYFSGEQHQIYKKRIQYWNAIREIYKDRLINVNEPHYPRRNEIYDLLPVIYQNADYALNLDAYHPAMKGFTSNRIYAILNLGGLLVTHFFEGMEDLGLDDMVNCVAFESTAMLEDKIQILDSNPKLAESIRKSGYALVKSRHTNAHRLISIMKVVGDA